MKPVNMMIALSAVALVSATPLLAAQAQQGSKCNDERQVCMDKNGPSVDLTRQRYGDQAAQRLERNLSKGGSGQQQPQSPPPQQPPARPQQPQSPPQQPPARPQQPPPQPQSQSGDVFSPMAGVRCVRSQHICYKNNRPDAALTSQYFGGDASNRRQYELSR